MCLTLSGKKFKIFKFFCELGNCTITGREAIEFHPAGQIHPKGAKRPRDEIDPRDEIL